MKREKKSLRPARASLQGPSPIFFFFRSYDAIRTTEARKELEPVLKAEGWIGLGQSTAMRTSRICGAGSTEVCEQVMAGSLGSIFILVDC